MPEFPAVTFSGDRDGLFSPDEVKSLMRAECARATRYKYAVTAMRVAVDRLDQLGDLYGFESREEILNQVTAVISRNTRESDFLGFKVGGTFHALFPHTNRKVGAALARRLLEDTSRLLFDEGSARVQVTLSIGISYRDAGEEVSFDGITREAASAIDRALSRGGNCFEIYVAPDPILDSLPDVSDVLGDDRALARQLAGLLDEKMQTFFQSMGESMPDFGGRDREVLALAVEKMEAAHHQMREEHAHQVKMLQRRLSKVTDSLTETEGIIRRGLSQKELDSGVASIYRTVQGLSDVENDQELKKEMMSKIFEANLELRNR
jgi:diguanylate cyclase (GGDEF)-like protein